MGEEAVSYYRSSKHPFSAVSKPTEDSFCSIFRTVQVLHTFALFFSEKLSKKSLFPSYHVPGFLVSCGRLRPRHGGQWPAMAGDSVLVAPPGTFLMAFARFWLEATLVGLRGVERCVGSWTSSGMPTRVFFACELVEHP